MAKTQNTSSEPVPGAMEPAVDTFATAEGKNTQGGKNKQEEPTQGASVEIPAFARSILQKFPQYKELYIDKDGGMFTPKTLPAVRKDAVLYPNPYHKS